MTREIPPRSAPFANGLKPSPVPADKAEIASLERCKTVGYNVSVLPGQLMGRMPRARREIALDPTFDRHQARAVINGKGRALVRRSLFKRRFSVAFRTVVRTDPVRDD